MPPPTIGYWTLITPTTALSTPVSPWEINIQVSQLKSFFAAAEIAAFGKLKKENPFLFGIL